MNFGNQTIVVGTIGQTIAYALIIPAPPFPVIVLALGIYSFSTSMQNSQVNSFVAGMNDPSKMAILHAVYGTKFLCILISCTKCLKRHRGI